MQNHTLSCRNTILFFGLGAVQAYGIQGLTGLKGGGGNVSQFLKNFKIFKYELNLVKVFKI